MPHFDGSKRVLRGKIIPQVYHEYVSVGQVILFEIRRYQKKVLQVNDDDGVELTGQQISDLSIKVAKNLYRLGMRCGDYASLCVSNTTYVAPILFGCLLLKIVVNPVEKFFEVHQIVEIFEYVDPKIVFCDHDNVDAVLEALQIIGSDARIFSMTERVENHLHVSDLLMDVNIDIDDIIYRHHTSDIPALTICTSGSTGRSKLALIPHLQLVQCYSWFEDYNQDRFSYCPSSMFWLNGIVNVIYKTLNGQKRLITARPFSSDLFFELIKKYAINECNLFTPLLKLIIESPKFNEADFSKFDMIVTGGVAVPESLRQILVTKLTNGKFVVGYGQSETLGISSKVATLTASTSIGIPCSNTEIKILLDDGTTAFLKETGEILVRHPIKFLGYLNCQMSQMDDDDWFHTGDMGYIDDNHELNIVGQKSQVIKNVHNDIYPFEIENKIESIPGVKRVVVVGTPDSLQFELPTALIVLDKNVKLTEHSINSVLNTFPDHQQLTGGIFFVDELPLTALGKVKRNEAKELAEILKMKQQSSIAAPNF